MDDRRHLDYCKMDHKTNKMASLDQVNVDKVNDGIDGGIVEANFGVSVDNLMKEEVKSDAGHMGHEEVKGQVNTADVDDEGSDDDCRELMDDVDVVMNGEAEETHD